MLKVKAKKQDFWGTKKFINYKKAVIKEKKGGYNNFWIIFKKFQKNY